MLMENWQSFRLLERKEYNLKPWKKNRNLIVIRDRWGPSKDRWAVRETRWCLTKRLRKTCMKKVTSLFRAHGSREKGSSGFRGPLRYVQKLLKSGMFVWKERTQIWRHRERHRKENLCCEIFIFWQSWGQTGVQRSFEGVKYFVYSPVLNLA